MSVGLTAVAALAFLVWLATRATPQLALAVALPTTVLLDWYSARRAMRDVELRVTGPADASAGEPLTWTVQVQGIRRPVVVAPAVLPRLPQTRVTNEAPGLVTMIPLRRGVLTSLLLDTWTVGPLGLVASGRRYRLPLTTPVHIGPVLLPQDITWPAPRAARFGTAEHAPVGDEVFRSVRDYIRGDSRRRVHWKATAHHGRLMVRESDGTGVVALRVVLELPPLGPVADVVASLAAWLVDEALRQGWYVHLVTRSAEIHDLPPFHLGSPFSTPALPPDPPAVPLRTVDQRIATRSAATRQLASAASGAPALGRWTGVTATVSAEGVRWS